MSWISHRHTAWWKQNLYATALLKSTVYTWYEVLRFGFYSGDACAKENAIITWTPGTRTYYLVSSRDLVISNLWKTTYLSPARPTSHVTLDSFFDGLSSYACKGIGSSASLSKAAGTLVVGLWTDISEFIDRNHEESLKVRCSSIFSREAEVGYILYPAKFRHFLLTDYGRDTATPTARAPC